MLLFQKKGEGLDALKRLIPLQMFAPVLSQESDVQLLSFVYVMITCFLFLVFFILYRLDRWFSRLNGFTLVIFGTLYILLFGASQGSVLKAVH